MTGVTNPPSSAPLTDFYITIKQASKATGTYLEREKTLTGLATGLTTCAKSSESGSAAAVIGFDLIGVNPGRYRFRFLT